MKLSERIFIDQQIIVTPTSNGHPLEWCDAHGFGYLRSNGYDYGESYWQKYLSYNDNGIGIKVTDYREKFVRTYLPKSASLCDVGIGSGQFVERMRCDGYDVNPYAQEWLKSRNAWGNPIIRASGNHPYDALSLWDVLEHIDDPTDLLNSTQHIFTSLPIHKDMGACLKSKHLRPDEHIWHFTETGLRYFMKLHDFTLVASGNGEIEAGREDIYTYYFKKNQ